MSAPRTIRNLALTGFMGTGKSSVARILAGMLQFELVDTDELIEARAGMPITRIFSEQGEAAFREMEAGVVRELSNRTRLVISTGGGLATRTENLERLKEYALVVCLWASPKTIYERVKNQNHRPLLQGENPLEKIEKLLSEREPFYKQADILVSSDFRSVRDVAQHVFQEFQALRSKVP